MAPLTTMSQLSLTEKQPSTGPPTQGKIWLTSAKILATLVVAIFIYGAVALKTTVRLQKTKNGVDVEIAHTPNSEARWIYISGNSDVWTSGSIIQTEGENCAIIHRLSWRVPKVGILEVRIDVRDA